MTYFADLTPYSYGPDEGLPGDLNIGWIAAGMPYTHGSPPEGFITALITCAARPVRLFRGIHTCELCGATDVHFDLEGREVHLGNGEIRVTARDGSAWTAPTLVVHYVETHGYLPPPAFIAAVMEWARTHLVVKGHLLEELSDASPAELHRRCFAVVDQMRSILGADDPRVSEATDTVRLAFAEPSKIPVDRRSQHRLWTIIQLLEDVSELGVDPRTSK